jgi:hypothetical protein
MAPVSFLLGYFIIWEEGGGERRGREYGIQGKINWKTCNNNIIIREEERKEKKMRETTASYFLKYWYFIFVSYLVYHGGAPFEFI